MEWIPVLVVVLALVVFYFMSQKNQSAGVSNEFLMQLNAQLRERHLRPSRVHAPHAMGTAERLGKDLLGSRDALREQLGDTLHVLRNDGGTGVTRAELSAARRLRSAVARRSLARFGAPAESRQQTLRRGPCGRRAADRP